MIYIETLLVASEMLTQATQRPHFKVTVLPGEPLASGVHGQDFDYPGLADIDPIADEIPLPHVNHYIRGPVPFIRMRHDALNNLGISEEKIHYEVFGPVFFAEERSSRSRRL